MAIDVASVDEALTTTRAVRLRLDLDRHVDDQIIYDCIDIAEQAPSGGNQGSRRWIVVRDPERKAQVAELYMRAAGGWMIATRDQVAGTGHPQEATMRSAAHLAEHLAEVPAIVIPTILGVHDGSGRPGLFDSVIQAVWSFCVALRARGLGSAWTTAILGERDRLADLLGIPEGVTQIAMIPVAWSKGTDFGRAPRRPAREITYTDTYGTTWERGPSNPPRLADGPGTVVELDVDAPAAAVWPYVSDIEFGAGHSAEFLGARWLDDVGTTGVGARFVGRNRHEAIGEWEVTCFVSHYLPEREFGWVTSDPDDPGARWCFELVPIAGATRLRYTLRLGPGPSGIDAAIEAMPDKEPRIIARRIREHRANMQAVVSAIARAATSGASMR